MGNHAEPINVVEITQRQPDVLVIYFNTVSGENDDLLGVDETPITNIYWIAVDVSKNKVIKEGEFTIRSDEDERAESDRSESDDIKPSETFKEAIREFTEILCELSENDKLVRLVTENGLHLRQCLHPRVFQREMELDDMFYTYYDIRKEYKASTKSSNGFKNLKEIANDMLATPEEKDLSTPELKSKFCVEVVQHLIKKEHTFTKPDEISRGLQAGISAGYVKDDTIIRSRGLPWQVSDIDVAEFFVGLNITKGGVALCLNLKGRRNGEALVRFENLEQRDLALKRHKHHLLGRYIEVYKGTAQEFLKIAKGPAGPMQATATFLTNGGEVIIRMRGLPFDATVEDIVSFFGESPKVYHGKDGVMLVSHPDGSSTGDAFVLFETEPEGQLALKKHRENIGKRYIELFRSTRAELQQVLTMYNVGYQLNNPFGAPMFPTAIPNAVNDRSMINQRLQALMNMSCLRMRGLPFSANHKDVISFLSAHAESVIGAVHIIYNLQGRPSGEAFVQMQNPDQAYKSANDLHLKHMGERYIEVFQCSVQDMTWMLATSHANQLAAQQLNHANNNNTANTNNNIKNNKNTNSNNTKYHTGTPSPPPLLQTTQAPPITGLMTTPPPPPPTITTNGFLSPSISPVPMYTAPFPPMLSPIPAGFMPPPHLSPTHGVPPPPPHCMIGHVYNPESLHFRVNQYGKPNGVAYIAFNSPEEAHRAIQEKNRHNIGNRYVEMFIAH